MNHLGLCSLWAALQATLLVGPIALTYWVASRRGPAAAAWATTLGLGVAMAVGLLAFVPDRWMRMPENVMAVTKVDVETSGNADVGRKSDAKSSMPGLSLGRLMGLWSRLDDRAGEATARGRPWAFVAWAMVAGWLIGLVRLILGLLSLAVARGRAVPVWDAGWLGRRDELAAEIGLTRPVGLFELEGLGTPATAGWLRPAIFLPPGWEDWSPEERDAVLAHELGHVGRGDFLAGLFGQLVLAFYFYHPFIHWMVGRLRFAREAAADAVGARLSGGPTAYARRLSSLTLRLDGRSPSWPVRALLPARGSSLIRRIEMLRNDDRKDAGLTTRFARGRIALPLLMAAVAVVALRGPAPQSIAAEPAAGLSAPEVNYLPDDTMGMVVVRPAALFGQPGMKAIAPEFNRRLWTSIGIDMGTKKAKKIEMKQWVKVEEIEWISAGLDVERQKTQDGRHTFRNAFPRGVVAMRTTRPIAWDQMVKEFGVTITPAEENGHAIFLLKGPQPQGEQETPLAAYLPDPRTIVVGTEAQIRKVLAGPPGRIPAYLRPADWEHMASGLAAVAFHLGDGRVQKAYNTNKPQEAWMKPFFDGAETFVARVDNADHLGLAVKLACRDEARARELHQRVKTLLDLSKGPDGVEQAAREAVMEGFRAAASKAAVETSGRSLTVGVKGIIPWKEFFDALGVK